RGHEGLNSPHGQAVGTGHRTHGANQRHAETHPERHLSSTFGGRRPSRRYPSPPFALGIRRPPLPTFLCWAGAGFLSSAAPAHFPIASLGTLGVTHWVASGISFASTRTN